MSTFATAAKKCTNKTLWESISGRRCNRRVLGFLCLLGMHEWCSRIVYFRGWLRCEVEGVELYWTWIWQYNGCSLLISA